MDIWQAIGAAIGTATGAPFVPEGHGGIGGGCISSAFRLDGGGRSFFVKLNEAHQLDMFEAEFAGLQAMAQAGALRVPHPVVSGRAGSQAFLVMEYLQLGGRGADAARRLGERLAALHRVSDEAFGWQRDNTIGATPQPNRRDPDWLNFWREQRLGFQLGLAADRGHGGRLQRQGERLMADLPALLDGHEPPPSLLHGDLWSGNYSVAADGEPVVYDPAVYFGDREADLAMTELFGGFPADFYTAYRAAWPLDDGYAVRKILYNLYHVLNHLNLFGGGYAGQAEHMIDQLNSELG